METQDHVSRYGSWRNSRHPIVFSDSGWMQAKLFDSWLRKHFMRYAPASRPLLLLLEGHSSHFCPDTRKLAAENGIIIFTLPPNTTHLTQPLDTLETSLPWFSNQPSGWVFTTSVARLVRLGYREYDQCQHHGWFWNDRYLSCRLGCCTLFTAMRVHTIRRNH